MNRKITGTFSENKNKTTDKHPDFKGQAKDVDTNEEFWYAAWKANGTNGPFQRFELTLKDQPQPNE